MLLNMTREEKAFITASIQIKADAENKHYIAVKASVDTASTTLYSDMLTVRAGGIELVPIDLSNVPDSFVSLLPDSPYFVEMNK